MEVVWGMGKMKNVLLAKQYVDMTDRELSVEILEDVEAVKIIWTFLSILDCLIVGDRFLRAFIFNLDNMLSQYTIYTSGDVQPNNPAVQSADEIYVAINALMTNYLTSSKSLVEHMEKSLEHLITKEVAQSFTKDYLSGFHMKFAKLLRNLSQHSIFPIYTDHNGKYVFDLNHMLDASRFKYHDKATKERLENLREDVAGRENGMPMPYIGIVHTMSIYETELMKSYLRYMKLLKSELKRALVEKEEVVKKNKSMLFRLNGHQALAFIRKDEEQVRTFYPHENSMRLFSDLEKFAIDKHQSLIANCKNIEESYTKIGKLKTDSKF